MLDRLLQSEWLIRMLDKTSQDPKQKLLALFDILDDILSSPLAQPHDDAPIAHNTYRLQAYLTTQAQLAKAKLPEMLANQLYFMAISACQDKLSHPQSTALQHARLAAKALTEEQTKRELHWPVIRNYAIALSTLAIGIWGGYSLNSWWPKTTPAPTADLAQTLPQQPLSQEASPGETAAIYARLETMRHGECRLIEAIQLPERLKSIYIENVINGHVTTNREEQVLVNQLLDQVQCNYIPRLMQISK